jgi:FkbM family methyltransferase
MGGDTFVHAELAKVLQQYEARAFHDPDFAAFLVMPPGSVRVILDVGANRGQSIVSLRVAFEHAHIHGFEANPVFFDVLHALVAAIPGPVTIGQHGLGRANGKVPFYIPWSAEVAYLEESSMRRDYYSAPWVVEKYRERGGGLRLEERVVEIRAGDELGIHPDLVKIDVEGAEHDVLLGLTRTIESARPHLLVENSDWNHVTPFLEALGYRAYRWEPDRRLFVAFHGQTTNTFYLHPQRLAGLPLE